LGFPAECLTWWIQKQKNYNEKNAMKARVAKKINWHVPDKGSKKSNKGRRME